MNDLPISEIVDIPVRELPIKIRKYISTHFSSFCTHFHKHDQIELLYIYQGTCTTGCNSKKITLNEHDLLLVNSNEIHGGINYSKDLIYYCLIIDLTLFSSPLVDCCDNKYINPILKSMIIFDNNLSHNQEAKNAIKQIIYEYETQQIGFEFAIKAHTYQFFTSLLRNNIYQKLPYKKYHQTTRKYHQLFHALSYIEEHYMDKIEVTSLCKISNFSYYYFSHLFKEVTGKTVSDYILSLRLRKAEQLLLETNDTISDIALEAGFYDISYFSRTFHKYYNMSPSSFRKQKKFHP